MSATPASSAPHAPHASHASHASQPAFTKTENGAVALDTSGNDIVDYFMLYTRTLTKEQNYQFLEKCWAINPKKTVAVIFNGRDRLKGKKEKTVSNQAMLWLRDNKPYTYMANILTYVNNYGRWKDLLYICYENKSDGLIDGNYELTMFADKLRDDLAELKISEFVEAAEAANAANAADAADVATEDTIKNKRKVKSVSLCAKWAPSENDRNDSRKHFAKKIATILYGRDDAKKMEKYRKEYLAPLRKKINIVERLMCNNEWDKINYESVPGVASRRLHIAFNKHDSDRYCEYLATVRKGDAKINITGILPHELANYYVNLRSTQDEYEENETIELQWRAIVNDVKSCGILGNSLAIIDLSGSMFSASNGSVPAQVAISLGIITSLCCKGLFKNKFITFSDTPELVSLIPDNLYKEYTEKDIEPSLYTCFKSLVDVEFGYNTNFVKSCEMIIKYGKEHNIADADMPKKLFVFTDMQFDEATVDVVGKEQNGIEVLYKTIVKMFKAADYTAPKFVFWNLNSCHKESFPVNCNTEGTAMISGFSEQLLKIFMTYDEFKPELIVEEILAPYLPEIYIDKTEY
uniref:TROVE domain-containing protein n=1 Tax=viral metagenome TaxID=1070528 RepID=A0A6C0K9L9_9ZZZZ